MGQGPVAEALRERALGAGLELRDGGPAALVVDAGVEPHPSRPDGDALVALCAGTSLAARGQPTAVGFHLLPVEDASLVELTRLPTTPAAAAEAAEGFFGALGLACEWVEDAPGLVLGRIVAQLVNEAAFAIGEGVGSPDDVDTGLELGLSHPRGPVAWSEALGLVHVLAILDGLWDERHEERYRAAPLSVARRASGVAFADTMATADLTILALGRSDVSASAYIAEIQRKLARQERVRYRMHAMGTSLEGPTEDILAVVGELHALPFEQGVPRVYTVLKLDERRDRPRQSLDDKVRAVEDLLGGDI